MSEPDQFHTPPLAYLNPEFLATQGDIWDTQKDMFMAGFGAVLAMVVIATVRRRRRIAANSADERDYAVTRYKPN